MKRLLLISFILILLSITTKAQSTSDSIQVLTKKFELLEKKTYDAGVHLQNFYFYQKRSIVSFCIGFGSSAIGSYFLTKSSNFSYAPTIILYTISAVTLTTGIIYQFRSFKCINNAGIELTSGINQVGLKINF